MTDPSPDTLEALSIRYARSVRVVPLTSGLLAIFAGHDLTEIIPPENLHPAILRAWEIINTKRDVPPPKPSINELLKDLGL